MKFTLKTYSIFDAGKRTDSEGRPHQEDSIYPQQGFAEDSDRLYIVCDGMGGHTNGEVASRTVSMAIAESILCSGADPEGAFDDSAVEQAVTFAYDCLDKVDGHPEDTNAARKMGTTLAMLKLHQDGATVAHIGDSRVYQIRPGEGRGQAQVVFRTDDDSLVNVLIKVGELSEDEARQSSQKNVITKAIQPNTGTRFKASVHHITDIRPGDCFLVCSDGIVERTDDDRLCEIFSISSHKDRLAALVAETADNNDNHSAWIISVEDVKGAVPAPTVAIPTAAATAAAHASAASAPAIGHGVTPPAAVDADDVFVAPANAPISTTPPPAVQVSPSSGKGRDIRTTILFFSVAFIVAIIAAMFTTSLFNRSGKSSLDESTPTVNLEDITDDSTKASKAKTRVETRKEQPAEQPTGDPRHSESKPERRPTQKPTATTPSARPVTPAHTTTPEVPANQPTTPTPAPGTMPSRNNAGGGSTEASPSQTPSSGSIDANSAKEAIQSIINP